MSEHLTYLMFRLSISLRETKIEVWPVDRLMKEPPSFCLRFSHVFLTLHLGEKFINRILIFHLRLVRSLETQQRRFPVFCSKTPLLSWRSRLRNRTIIELRENIYVVLITTDVCSHRISFDVYLCTSKFLNISISFWSRL